VSSQPQEYRCHQVPDVGKITWHQLDFWREFMAAWMVSVSYQTLSPTAPKSMTEQLAG